ncbi:MAG: hypothetical protein ACFE9Z_02670 [Promethearchaeota archaeon]
MEKITSKIQNHIKKLEKIHNNIIEYFNSLNELDNTTRDLWISDVKNFYYSIFSSWQVITSNIDLIENDIEKIKNSLYVARNILSKINSELNIFHSKYSSDLTNELSIYFKECWDAFWLVFKKLLTKKEKVNNLKKVIKVSDLEYHLPCSKCGKIAVKYIIGYGRFDENEALVFRGITHERSLKINLSEELFKLLQKEDLEGIHNFMKKHHSFEGLDAYCPKCDKIYCWEHYDAREEYDDGFYDCTYAICPNGHKRMIDD